MEEDLGSLECPFRWNIPAVPRRNDFLKKLRNNEEQVHFLMNGFCVRLVECFERAQGGDIETAIRMAKECETELSEYIPTGLNKSVDECLWKKSSEAMWHVLHSTQAHLAFKIDDSETLDKLIAIIKPVELFDDDNKAAILGIKSRFFMEYGPFETTNQAIAYLRRAIEIDKSTSLWHFYLGKCLGRFRRANAYCECPSQEEIDALEKAFSMSKTPEKGVMLLQSYCELEKSNRMQRKKMKNKLEIETRIRDLLSFIQNCTGDEWYVYWRCANVAMKLSSHLVKKSEIKILIDMAVESSNHNHNASKKFLNGIQSKYYRIYEKDYPKALTFAEEVAKAGGMHGCYDVLLLKYRINKEEDLLPVIDAFIRQDNLVEKVDMELSTIKANYLFFVKHESLDAIKLYIKVMEKNCKHYSLLNCRPLFYESPKPYNLYEKLETFLSHQISLNKDKSITIVYKGFLDKIRDFEEKSKMKE